MSFLVIILRKSQKTILFFLDTKVENCDKEDMSCFHPIGSYEKYADKFSRRQRKSSHENYVIFVNFDY